MFWQSKLKGDPIPWLLEDENPAVRYLALRDLMDLPPASVELSEARRAAHASGAIAALLDKMDPAGWWAKPGPGYNPRYRSTDWSIISLAQMGASAAADERVARGCAYLLDYALAPGGKFSYNGAPSGTVDCLQGNLCRALTELGAEDKRLDQAFDWMARTVTGEGLAPPDNRESEDRYYAAKYGPDFACGYNGKKPCAWGAAKVMLAFASLPAAKRTPPIDRAIQRGVDFLFSVDPASAAYPTRNNDKPSRNWREFAFPVFYNADLLQVVEALTTLGYGNDPRLVNTLDLVIGKQDEDGCWPLEHQYTVKAWFEFGAKGSPSKWVTLRALRVLKAAFS
jgi:hypothetical protein